MPWKKGQSGNPNGAKPKEHAFAVAVERMGEKPCKGGKWFAGCKSKNEALAKIYFDMLLNGKAILGNGTEVELSVQDHVGMLTNHVNRFGVPKDSGDIPEGTYTVKIVRGASMEEL